VEDLENIDKLQFKKYIYKRLKKFKRLPQKRYKLRRRTKEEEKLASIPPVPNFCKSKRTKKNVTVVDKVKKKKITIASKSSLAPFFLQS